MAFNAHLANLLIPDLGFSTTKRKTSPGTNASSALSIGLRGGRPVVHTTRYVRPQLNRRRFRISEICTLAQDTHPAVRGSIDRGYVLTSMCIGLGICRDRSVALLLLLISGREGSGGSTRSTRSTAATSSRSCAWKPAVSFKTGSIPDLSNAYTTRLLS